MDSPSRPPSLSGPQHELQTQTHTSQSPTEPACSSRNCQPGCPPPSPPDSPWPALLVGGGVPLRPGQASDDDIPGPGGRQRPQSPVHASAPGPKQLEAHVCGLTGAR